MCKDSIQVLSGPLEIDNNSINININDNIKSCRWNGPIQVLSGPSRCSIGQHHQHKHIICVGQWTRPPSSTLFALSTPYLPSVVFSRLGCIRRGGGHLSYTNHYHLCSVYNSQQHHLQPQFTFLRRSFSASLYCIGDGGASPARILS